MTSVLSRKPVSVARDLHAHGLAQAFKARRCIGECDDGDRNTCVALKRDAACLTGDDRRTLNSMLIEFLLSACNAMWFRIKGFRADDNVRRGAMSGNQLVWRRWRVTRKLCARLKSREDRNLES